MKTVWVFIGETSRIPAGIFISKVMAEAFIRNYGLSGTLSEFPLDVSAYDHAIKEGLFKPTKPKESDAWFIADFSPRLPHEHWNDGEQD